jgi:hypothetical protein
LGGTRAQEREKSREKILLIVALQLLGLVVATRITLPRAVVEAIGLRDGILVQVVGPGRLTVGSRAGKSGSRRQEEVIAAKAREGVGMDLRGKEAVRGKAGSKPGVARRVRIAQWCCRRMAVPDIPLILIQNLR